MENQIELTHGPNRGRIAPLTVVDLPAPVASFIECEKNPQLIIDILKSVDGDIDAFIKQFNTRSPDTKITVLIKALVVLGRKGNEEQLEEWNELIAAFNAAKYMLAENAAVKFVGDYEPPKGQNKKAVKISDFVSFSRLWMAQHLEKEKMKGRKAGNAVPDAPKEAEGGGAPASILAGLKGEQENESD